MYVTLSIVLALLTVALIALIIVRERRMRTLESTYRRLGEIIDHGRFDQRIDPTESGDGLVTSANALLEQVASRDVKLRERELNLDMLLTSLQEAVAIQRESIVFANARFAALTGHDDPKSLVGQRLGQVVSAEYAELVDLQIAQVLAGDVASTHLEVELQPAPDRTKASSPRTRPVASTT
jgi:PAS domain-containing protein